MLKLTLFFITSYLLTAWIGWTLRGMIEKDRQQQAYVSRNRWTSYERKA